MQECRCDVYAGLIAAPDPNSKRVRDIADTLTVRRPANNSWSPVLHRLHFGRFLIIFER